MVKTASWLAVAGLILVSVAQRRPRPNSAVLADGDAPDGDPASLPR